MLLKRAGKWPRPGRFFYIMLLYESWAFKNKFENLGKISPGILCASNLVKLEFLKVSTQFRFPIFNMGIIRMI